MSKRFFSSQKAPRAASRLWELVDFESSTNRTPLCSPQISNLCGSPWVSEKQVLISDKLIPISSATIATESKLRALCSQDSGVCERKNLFSWEKTISSPSVQSRGVIFLSVENFRIFGDTDNMSPFSRANSKTESFMTVQYRVWETRFIFASRYSWRSRCQFRWSTCRFVKTV